MLHPHVTVRKNNDRPAFNGPLEKDMNKKTTSKTQTTGREKKFTTLTHSATLF